MNRVLIVVDMQNDFVDGALGSREAASIIPRVVKKINDFDGDIMVTLDTHTADYLKTQEGRSLPVPHCIEKSSGWRLTTPVYDALLKKSSKKESKVRTFRKNTFASVELSNWLALMDGDTQIDEIVLVGLCTDICVISNALLIKAFLPEVKVTVDASCCAGVTPESHNNALAAMEMCQINIENKEFVE